MANLNIPDKADPPAGRVGRQPHRPGGAPVGRHAPGHGDQRDHRHGSDVITMQDIFVFEQHGLTPEGQSDGRFRATGIRPKCAEQLADAGLHPAARHVRARQAGGVRADHADPSPSSSSSCSRSSSASTGLFVAAARGERAGRRCASACRRRRQKSANAVAGCVRATERSARFPRSIDCCARARQRRSPLQRLIDRSRALKITVGHAVPAAVVLRWPW